MMPVIKADLSLLPTGAKLPLVQVAFASSTLFDNGWRCEMGAGLKGDALISRWRDHMLENENTVMPPGPCFGFFEKSLKLNDYIEHEPNTSPLDRKAMFQSHIVSRMHPDCAVRFLNTLEEYGLMRFCDYGLLRTAFLGGGHPAQALLPLGVQLYLTGDKKVADEVTSRGLPAAHIEVSGEINPTIDDPHRLHIVFDGDAVIFSDVAERIYQEQGLEAFNVYCQNGELPPGPLAAFAMAMGAIRCAFPLDSSLSPLTLAMNTARGPRTQRQALLTLRRMGIRLDRFNGNSGLEKTGMLVYGGTTIFFDDGRKHIDRARSAGVVAAHVPWGVGNEPKLQTAGPTR